MPAWLFRVVRTGLLEKHRRDTRRKNREEKTVESRDLWFKPNHEIEFDSQLAAQRFGELPLEQREIVVAKIWGTLTFDEIAKLLDIPKTSVFRIYSEALESLREKMQ